MNNTFTNTFTHPRVNQVKAAWAEAQKSPLRKTKLVPREQWLKNKTPVSDYWGCYGDGAGNIRVPGFINAGHHILYNIIRGKDATHGFTDVTNQTKLNNGVYVNNGVYHHLYILNSAIEKAKKFLTHDYFSTSSGSIAKLTRETDVTAKCQAQKDKDLGVVMMFLAPFGESITVEDMALLNPIKITPITCPALVERNRIASEKSNEILRKRREEYLSKIKNKRPATPLFDLWDIYDSD